MLSDTEFEAQLRTAMPKLMRYATKLRGGNADSASDLLQETLVVCWRRRRDYNPSLSSMLTWASWQMRGARHAEDKARQRRVSTCALSDPVAAKAAAAATQEHSAELRRIERLIRKLPPQQRTTLRLTAEGHGLNEIGRIMGFTPQNARQLLSKAREKLARWMAQ